MSALDVARALLGSPARAAATPVDVRTLPLMASYLSARHPDLRERVGSAVYDVANALGMSSIAQRMRMDAQTGVDFVPGLGDAVGLDEAARDFGAGNYGMAAAGLGLTALGAVPGVGDAAAGALRALPSSASLNLPRQPTIDELRQFARQEPVPLSMARGSQPKMQWERFNAGQYGEPMFPGYVDAPVAVRRRDGEYVILDGHHRSVAAMNKGQSELPMYVIDAETYDPANAGRKPAASDISDVDALLKELGL